MDAATAPRLWFGWLLNIYQMGDQTTKKTTTTTVTSYVQQMLKAT